MEKVKINKAWPYALAIKKWIRNNRQETIALVLILLVGAFLRLYKIDQYMTFLGDEGRDVIIVRRLLVNGDLILIGPGTSIGNMYLGPLYYYMMAPALLLANFSPVGPAVQIALLGTATIFFVWYLARDWFGQLAALVASALYAIAPTIIVHSRFSWNPNIMPFFALLIIYSIWKIWQTKQHKWLVALGISYAFVLQSHYLGLILASVIFVFWLKSLKKVKNKKPYIRYTIYSSLIFLLLMSPLVIFDIRHNWMNFSALREFITSRESAVSINLIGVFANIWPLFNQINTSLLAGRNEIVGLWVSIVMVALLTWLILFKWKKLSSKLRATHYLLLAWFGFGILGLAVYRKEIYDHYFGFLFPAPFLLLGALAENLIFKNKNLKIIVFSVLFGLFIVNFVKNPIKNPPNRQLQRTQEVARKIVHEADSKDFNLAVLAERNYERAYQYFLEAWNAPIVMIDPQRAGETITKQLFVVCELIKEECDPTRSPKAEVANFGWSKIEKEWEVGGAVLYKLVHSR